MLGKKNMLMKRKGPYQKDKAGGHTLHVRGAPYCHLILVDDLWEEKEDTEQDRHTKRWKGLS